MQGGNTSVEDMIKQVRREENEKARRGSTEPSPAIYLRLRSNFSQKLRAKAVKQYQPVKV